MFDDVMKIKIIAYWEISAVRSCASAAPNVPIRPRSVTLRHESNSEAGRTAFSVARRAEGMPHLGTCLPVLPAFQSLPPHSYSIGRLYTAGSPFPARAHRLCGAPSDVSGLHIRIPAHKRRGDVALPACG